MRRLFLLGVGLSLFGFGAVHAAKPQAAAIPGNAESPPAPNKERQSPEAQLKDFIVPEGFKVELVAAEPLLVNPVTLALDEQGRMYVGESHTYRWGPKGSPYPTPTNPIVLLKPKADGGFERFVVAEGFDDPVMGLLVKDGKLWATSNQYLYQFDLDENGRGINRKQLALDKNKAWNPFGNFVLEWGPDGLLYMSVGNHQVEITGANNTITSRGSSGIIVRGKPDGRDLEKLVQGLRVPYSFEYDPFGQLWLLSNGEGNPNRFVRVIEGVDYHCYTRTNDNEWLTGRHPLAPPCFELPGGANTQLMRYYGAAFPASYTGNLFPVNWGRHGFPSANHTVFRFITDEHNNVVDQEAFIRCQDPHFRPTQILLAPDGNLLVTDWYGRDDENDVTGRIWKVSYVGSEKTAGERFATPRAWTQLSFAIDALGSADHAARASAAEFVVKQGSAAIKPLAEHAEKAKEALGAAGALWALARIGTPEALAQLSAGVKHGDWKVRRLALQLAKRYNAPELAALGKAAGQDKEPAVRIAAALLLAEDAQRRAALVDAITYGAANDAHQRYEAAWHLAHVADEAALTALFGNSNPNVRLAAMIALDVAIYEKTSAADSAKSILIKALAQPRSDDLPHLLKLVEMNRDPAFTPALVELITFDDTPVEHVGRAVLLLRAAGSADAKKLGEKATNKLLAAAREGKIAASSSAEKLLLVDLIRGLPVTAETLAPLAKMFVDNDPKVREAAHNHARALGHQAAPLAAACWKEATSSNHRPEAKLALLTTLAAIEPEPDAAQWKTLLNSPNDAIVRREIIRGWRRFQGREPLVTALVEAAPALIKNDAHCAGDVAVVLAHLGCDDEKLQSLGIARPDLSDKTKLASSILAESQERVIGRSQAGRAVFERAGCAKCHTADKNTKLGPPLAGIGKQQKPEYLVESILDPSKIIKTGFETESIQTADGKVLFGMVKEQGDALIVVEAEKETRLPKADVEVRQVQKKSLMPDGLEKQLSQAELADLLAYLISLK